MPGQLAELAPRGEHFGDAFRQVLDGGRGPAIGAHAKRIGALDLEEVGHAIEERGDVGVVDGHDVALRSMATGLRP